MNTITGVSTSSIPGLESHNLQEQKLRKAAAEFESQLLSSLWKSMKHTFSSDPDGDSLDPAGQSLEDMGIDAMCGAVSRAGGFGMGKLIIKDLTDKLDHS